MKQFLLPASFSGEESLTLTGKDFHYLCHVRRLELDDSLVGLARDGRRYTLTVTAVESDRCVVTASLWAGEADDRASGPAPDEVRITLFQCLPKGSKLDTIVRQVTEAGVARVVPVASRHSVVNLDDRRKIATRVERLRRIAREAVQQSGGSTLPEILEPVPFGRVPALHEPGGVGLYCDERSDTPLAHQSLHRYLSSSPHVISIVIGPEGGLAPSETALLAESGFLPVFLGNRILRTETAALYAVAATRIILLERKTWQIPPG